MQLPEFLTLYDLIKSGIFKSVDAYHNAKYSGKSVPEPIAKDVAGTNRLYFSRQTVQEWLKSQTNNVQQKEIKKEKLIRVKKNVTMLFTTQEYEDFKKASQLSNQMQLIKDALNLFYEHNKEAIIALDNK